MYVVKIYSKGQRMSHTEPQVTIRQLKNTEWQQYKVVRLNALKDSPEAFGSTYENSIQRTDQSWIDKVKEFSSELERPLVAIKDDTFVGLTWAMIEPPDTETAHIYQMWVSPTVRGFGVGRQLMQKAISWAKSKGVSTVALEVTCGDRPARRLYDRLGFKAVGNPIPMREGSNLLEQCMELKL